MVCQITGSPLLTPFNLANHRREYSLRNIIDTLFPGRSEILVTPALKQRFQLSISK